MSTNHITTHKNIEKQFIPASTKLRVSKKSYNRSNFYKAVSVKQMHHIHKLSRSLSSKETIALKVEKSLFARIVFLRLRKKVVKMRILCISIQVYTPFADPQRKNISKAYNSMTKVAPLNSKPSNTLHKHKLGQTINNSIFL